MTTLVDSTNKDSTPQLKFKQFVKIYPTQQRRVASIWYDFKIWNGIIKQIKTKAEWRSLISNGYLRWVFYGANIFQSPSSFLI